MPHTNMVSWTALISGYAQHGKTEQCFLLFSQMLSHYRPNDFTYTSVLSACDHLRGVQVHGLVSKTGFDSWSYVVNALIAMYWKNSRDSKCVEAWRVFSGSAGFHNLVTYNSMITGLGMYGQGDRAMTFFVTTMCRAGIEFDRTTIMSLVSSLVELNCCLQLHSVCFKTGLVEDVGVATALIKAYSSLGGELVDIYKLFEEIMSLNRDVVLWTTIMTAFSERDPEKALIFFNQMRGEELSPDCYVISILLKACANLVTERHALAVHSQVIKLGFLNVLVIQNALIHAYSRCGSIDKAEHVFNAMRLMDIVSWNSMLKAYALHGKAKESLNLFEQMDIKPDETTFVALLSSCSHAGFVKEGTKIFDTMYEKYEIAPQLDHYACMVDILGRAGHLSEAARIIRKMPMKPDYVVWSALLGACRKHGETKLADLASSKLKELDPNNSLGYVLISNIYCSANNFSEGGSLRKKMSRVGVRKEPGLSWTEVDHKVHEFASGGRKHPQIEAIRSNLDELLRKLRKMGYVPDTSLVLHDVEEEHKEEQLYHHSEKLAVVFSLMNTGNSRRFKGVIKIIKNIRICLDCHNFIRLVSELVEKEIVVRDSNRFHHFKEGSCSCNDYW
ncbi:hypothetical protein ACJIZ3_019168 [Penstemon smallii]|uniref:DYW domain-containing protein n=1 Tax=Penstemon smallii TaxID=265156 RepID=A0ABD3T181_9LAMI